jgi:hypothetical protein
MTDRNHRIAVQIYRNPEYFVLKASRRMLRSYQRDVLNAVVQSIREKAGRTFVVIFARQSGKNELQAQLFTYLLAVLSRYNLNIVSVSPTFKPQTLTAIGRLEKVLSRNLFTRNVWKRRDGYKVLVGSSQVVFLSGHPSASVVGETAHILLSVDEAQSFDPLRFDKTFAPMAAAHNATRVFWGTSWTSNTLLARERRLARLAEEKDGIRRLWIVPADQVAQEVPSYAAFLESEIRNLGRNHPIIRTQYFCEEIDAQAGMFNAARRALMQGDQSPHAGPVEGTIYAFLLDIAGQDESRMSGDELAPLTNPGRDSVSLTIASVDLSTLPTLQAPTFRFVSRKQWTGINHLTVFGQVKAIADFWLPQYFVVDATGVGEGFWAMLDKAYPTRVIPVKFSSQVKSEMGWRFLAIIETGRLRDCCLTDQVREQYDACQAEIMPGPGKIMRWGVPEGTRGADGELVHDDYLLADALIAEIDRLEWAASTDVFVGEGFNPLESVI